MLRARVVPFFCSLAISTGAACGPTPQTALLSHQPSSLSSPESESGVVTEPAKTSGLVDLQIDGLYLKRRGKTRFLRVQVSNVGSKASSATSVRLYKNAKTLKTAQKVGAPVMSLPPIAAGGDATVEFALTLTQQSTSYLAVVDENAVNLELKKHNNVAEVLLSWAPDLVLRDVILLPGMKGKLRVEVDVANRGNLPSGEFSVDVFTDASAIKPAAVAGTVLALSAGGRTTVAFEIPVPAVNITIVVDRTNQVAEHQETNNRLILDVGKCLRYHRAVSCSGADSYVRAISTGAQGAGVSLDRPQKERLRTTIAAQVDREFNQLANLPKDVRLWAALAPKLAPGTLLAIKNGDEAFIQRNVARTFRRSAAFEGLLVADRYHPGAIPPSNPSKPAEDILSKYDSPVGDEDVSLAHLGWRLGMASEGEAWGAFILGGATEGILNGHDGEEDHWGWQTARTVVFALPIGLAAATAQLSYEVKSFFGLFADDWDDFSNNVSGLFAGTWLGPAIGGVLEATKRPIIICTDAGCGLLASPTQTSNGERQENANPGSETPSSTCPEGQDCSDDSEPNGDDESPNGQQPTPAGDDDDEPSTTCPEGEECPADTNDDENAQEATCENDEDCPDAEDDEAGSPGGCDGRGDGAGCYAANLTEEQKRSISTLLRDGRRNDPDSPWINPAVNPGFGGGYHPGIEINMFDIEALIRGEGSPIINWGPQGPPARETFVAVTLEDIILPDIGPCPGGVAECAD